MQSGNNLSIIIPAFNAAHTIAPCLRAIKEQMKVADELIIIDDKSADATSSIARRYSDKVITHSYNKGAGASRNRGVEEATNQILLFIDADVIIAPHFLDYLRDFFAKEADSALTCQVDAEKKNNFFSDYKNLYLHFSFKEAHKNKKSYLYGSVFAISHSLFSSWPTQTRYLEDVLLLQKLKIKIIPAMAFPINHLKEYSFTSLFRYDFIMGKYYAAYKLSYQSISTTTHVRWVQQLSILLIPFIFLSLLFSPLLTVVLLTVLLLINWSQLSFNYRQRGLVFALISFAQLNICYSAYFMGSIMGVLNYRKLQKNFL